MQRALVLPLVREELLRSYISCGQKKKKKKIPPKNPNPKTKQKKKENLFQIEAWKPPELLLSPPSQASGLRTPWHSRGQNPFFCKSWFESEFCYLPLKESGLELPCWEMGSSRARVFGEPRSSTPRSESGRATPREEKRA